LLKDQYSNESQNTDAEGTRPPATTIHVLCGPEMHSVKN